MTGAVIARPAPTYLIASSTSQRRVNHRSANVLKRTGIGCFVLAAILLFVAWERYQDNASKIEAANKMMQSSPAGRYDVGDDRRGQAGAWNAHGDKVFVGLRRAFRDRWCDVHGNGCKEGLRQNRTKNTIGSLNEAHIPRGTWRFTMQLTAVFIKVAEGYTAFVEELPGANTQGDTLEEARENLKEAVALILEANREWAEKSLAGQLVIKEPFVLVAS